MPAPAPAHPSATVVLLRDGSDGIEVLLVRRNTQLKTHGGAWVFPGGRVDPRDLEGVDAKDTVAAARRAATREVAEEAGLEITERSLVPMALWITPDFMPKRFATWFFVAAAAHAEVRVDGDEIDAYRWVRPAEALTEQRASTLELPPPTFVTITQLAGYPSAEAALHDLSDRAPTRYTPKICRIEKGACSLYEGDAGYEAGDAALQGPRHRLWIVSSGWRYERSVGLSTSR